MATGESPKLGSPKITNLSIGGSRVGDHDQEEEDYSLAPDNETVSEQGIDELR